jgi:hypothetical protein
MFTAALVTAGLWLTFVPVSIISGVRNEDVWTAIGRFAADTLDGTMSTQEAILAVLAAIFIVRVIDRSAGASLAEVAGVWAVALVHCLAALVVDAGILNIIGIAQQGKGYGQIWGAAVLSIVAVVLAWWVDAGVTLRREEQLRRTEAELLTVSESLHQRAALLQPTRRVHRGSRRRLIVIVVAIWVLAVATAMAVALIGLRPITWPDSLLLSSFFGVIALWATFWAVFVTAAFAYPTAVRSTVWSMWAVTVFVVGYPTVIIFTVDTPAGAILFRIAVLTCVLVPFAHTMSALRNRWELRSALVAVELRRYRRRRWLLLRDYYVLRGIPSAAQASKAGLRTRVRRWLQRMVTSRSRRGSWVPLQTQRPADGVGSRAWWASAGKPPMYLP